MTAFVTDGLELKRLAVRLADDTPSGDDQFDITNGLRAISWATPINADCLHEIPGDIRLALARARLLNVPRNTAVWWHNNDGVPLVNCVLFGREALIEDGARDRSATPDARSATYCTFSYSQDGIGYWVSPYHLNVAPEHWPEDRLVMDRIHVYQSRQIDGDNNEERVRLLEKVLAARAALALAESDGALMALDVTRQRRRREPQRLGDEWGHRIVIRSEALRRIKTAHSDAFGPPLVRLHQVREHGADYSQGKGLFGRLRVKVTKKAHVRGDPTLGILRAPHWVIR